MLKIKKLTAVIDDDNLLDDINLEANKGEIHAIMGPPRSGKTMLSHCILGNPGILYKNGNITFKKKDILGKSINEVNSLGIFSSFQYPPVIEGISNFEFVKLFLTARKDKRQITDIEKLYKDLCKELGLSSNHGHKGVNHPVMTITECKKNELLHMLIIDPELIILDEIDAGVEDEEIELIGITIKKFLQNKSKAAIIISNNHTLLDIIVPTHVHIMVDGKFCEEGFTDLYKRIVTNGNS
jgi:Fe-S cluster assembly ATP-binding protein